MFLINKYFLLLFLSLPFLSFNQHQQKLLPEGYIKITFVNTINGVPVVLHDTTYTNTWQEQYIIDQLKYYISNVSLQSTSKTFNENNSYHLIDESKADSKSFSFAVKPGSFKSVSFLIGVDSLMNVSGAQSGALDPMNSMYWTWNSGYIMFKLEGASQQSSIVNNKIEYHIGGYAGINTVLRKKELVFAVDKTLEITAGKITGIIIEMDINKLWNAGYALKIAEVPACTTPGKLAATIANNYSAAFFIKDVFTNK